MSTSTTLPAPNPASAAAALVGAVEAATADGSLQPSLERTLISDVASALDRAASSDPSGAKKDLQSLDSSLAQAVQSGTLDPAVATALESDVSSLASALGLAQPDVPTTTTGASPGPGGPTASAPPGPPGHQSPPGKAKD